MRARPIPLQWAPLPPELAQAAPRLQEACERWLGTDYGSGQRCRGIAADCVGGGLGVLDEVDGRPRAQSPSVPADTALHDPRTSRKAVAAIRRAYSPAARLRRPARGLLEVQPGDILVVGTSAGGPGHLMIVGARKNELWHCVQNSGFTQAGWGLMTGFERVFAVYRLQDRERWIA